MDLNIRNLVVGAIVALVTAELWRNVLQARLLLKNFKKYYQIWGNWYCLEYVPGRGKSDEARYAYTTVRIRPTLRGKWVLKVISQFDYTGEDKDLKVEWTLRGRFSTINMMIGTWESDVPTTTRYGCAQIEFRDGKALGYWMGPSRMQHIVYGFCIMSKDKSGYDQLKTLASLIQNQKWPICADVLGFVINQTDFLKCSKLPTLKLESSQTA